MTVFLDTTWKTDGLLRPFMKEDERERRRPQKPDLSKCSFIRKIDNTHCDTGAKALRASLDLSQLHRSVSQIIKFIN